MGRLMTPRGRFRVTVMALIMEMSVMKPHEGSGEASAEIMRCEGKKKE